MSSRYCRADRREAASFRTSSRAQEDLANINGVPAMTSTPPSGARNDSNLEAWVEEWAAASSFNRVPATAARQLLLST